MIEIKSISESVREITITTNNNAVFGFLTIGAALTRWQTADGINVVAAYQDYNDYLDPGMYLGTNVGPLSGRIENGQFDFLGKHYKMDDINPHFLHSGKHGISFKNFDVEAKQERNGDHTVDFSLDYRHPILPGKIKFRFRYLIHENELHLTLSATSDKTCLCNLTNHSYFNLEGTFDQDLANHTLEIQADKVVLVDEDILGREIIPVEKTIFDFQKPKDILRVVTDPYLKNQASYGIDHYFVLKDERDYDVALYSKKSKKRLTIKSNYPGITIYTTNYPKPKPLRDGKELCLHGAIAMEPHFQTNAINDDRFKNYILRLGDTYNHEIIYRLEENV